MRAGTVSGEKDGQTDADTVPKGESGSGSAGKIDGASGNGSLGAKDTDSGNSGSDSSGATSGESRDEGEDAPPSSI